MKKLLLLAALPLLFAGCGSIATEYVAADELTYNAIEPEYRKYVEADPKYQEPNDPTKLNDSGKMRIADLDSWKFRIDEAKKAGGR